MGWCDPLEHPDPPSGEPKAKLLELFCNRCGNVMTLPPPPVFGLELECSCGSRSFTANPVEH